MPESTDRDVLSPWGVAGLIALACVAFLIGATQVAVGAPWWAIAALMVVWLVALALALAWFSRRPRLVVVLPLAVTIVWFATVVAGARWGGWTP